MPLLDLLLDKVKMADLEQFRQKVETMEKLHDERRKELGLDSIEDVVKAKERSSDQLLEVSSVSVYDNEVQQEVSKPINQSEESPEVFEKFLQSIRG